MPNQFGGDQLHPLYMGESLRRDPRRAISRDLLYEIHGNGPGMYVTTEAIDGRSSREGEVVWDGAAGRLRWVGGPLPPGVKRRIMKLLQEWYAQELKLPRSSV